MITYVMLHISLTIVAHESSPIYKGHKDLTSFLSSSKISLAVCNLYIRVTSVCWNKSNTSQHGLTTAMQHLYLPNYDK